MTEKIYRVSFNTVFYIKAENEITAKAEAERMIEDKVHKGFGIKKVTLPNDLKKQIFGES